jgi:NTP pyrophosphatase (non-canonical NTP hydrolase)
MKLTPEQIEILEKAREKYGDVAQLLVSIEELNELACVLAKYPRYDTPEQAKTELHQKALDEVADVYIILNHVETILGLDSYELYIRIAKKIERVERWLNTNDKFSQTLVDREVRE